MNRLFDAVGRCIYCRKTAAEANMAKLQDEHIIAESLAGKWILPEASCSKCADQTGADEGYCAGAMFKSARSHFGWKSKHSKKPKMLDLQEIAADGTVTKTQIPVDQYPFAIGMPVFEPPALLTGARVPRGSINCTGIQMFLGPAFDERMNRHGAKANATPFRPDRLCRMPAKIAHSYAVAKLGLDGFKPFLTDIILARADNFADFIGSPAIEMKPSDQTIHALELHSGKDFISVYIKLWGGDSPYHYLVLPGSSL